MPRLHETHLPDVNSVKYLLHCVTFCYCEMHLPHVSRVNSLTSVRCTLGFNYIAPFLVLPTPPLNDDCVVKGSFVSFDFFPTEDLMSFVELLKLLPVAFR